jgi:diacylglycerol kinase family enzyme
MAGTEASGKTQSDLAQRVTTVALVANERSGSNEATRCAERLRAYGAEVTSFDVEDVEAAVEAGDDRVVVAGGDGSIAPVAAAAGAAGIPLAVVPAGTANDFARRLGLPDSLSAACRLAVHGTILRPLELGWMNNTRPFVNVASVGLPAPAAERASGWKGRLGPLAYAAGALSAGLSAKPLTCLVLCDEERELLAGEAWQVTVAASGAFGAGAGVDEADPGDGALEVVAIEAGPRLGLVTLAYRLRRGRVTSHPRAFHARCEHAEVQVPDCTRFNVDGELVTEGDARFTAVKEAFRLVVG